MNRKSSFKELCVILVPSFVITAMAFAFYLQPHYSVDCYNIFYLDNADIWAAQSRYVSYLIGELLLKLGINVVKSQSPFTMVLLLAISYCISRITLLIEDSFKSTISSWIKVAVWTTVSVGFINVFFDEWFLYPSMALHLSVAMLFALEAIVELLNDNHRGIRYVLSWIYTTISLCTYQATLSIIITFYITLTLIKSSFEIDRTTIKRICFSMITIFLSCCPMIIIQKISNYHAERFPTFDLAIILGNIKTLIQYQAKIWINQLGFFPSYVLLFFLVALSGYLIYQVVKKRIALKNVFIFLIAIVICMFSVYAPHVINSNLWIVPRSIVGFWPVISCSCIMGMLLIGMTDTRTWRIYLICCLSILIINIVCIWGIGNNHYLSNMHDYEYVQKILSCIDKYERESGIEVEFISTCHDNSFQYSYPDVEYVYGDTNTKCFSVEWGDVSAINFYSGKNYIKKSMEPEIRNKFFNQNWDIFVEDEQLVFIDNTLYLCFF